VLYNTAGHKDFPPIQGATILMAESVDHLVKPEEAIRIALARQ
jgi:hypothetical protein